MKKVILIGRLPADKEVGGVTSFTYNLASICQDQIEMVVDFYPAYGKIIPKNVKVKCLKGILPCRLLALLLLHKVENQVIHHNYSTVNGILPLILFPKPKSTKWIIMLHNGDLQSRYQSFDFLRKRIVKTVLNRADLIASISKHQDNFYRTVTRTPACRVCSYISTGVIYANNVPRPGNPLRFIIAGFPTKIYRLLETISVFNRLWASGLRFELAVCIYGVDKDGLLKEIIQQVESLPFASYHDHLDHDEFLNVLKHSDCYVRMNSVDSFGIIVAEAIELGLSVIATNVCNRFQGTYLLDMDDFDRLEASLKYFCLKRTLDGILEQSTIERSMPFSELYGQLCSEE